MKLFKLINLVSPDLYQLFHMLVGEVQAQHGMKITDWINTLPAPEIKIQASPSTLTWSPGPFV